MRYLLGLLMIIGFVFFTRGQETNQKPTPIADPDEYSYDASRDASRELKHRLVRAGKRLNSSPDSKVVIIYYEAKKGKKIALHAFKLRVRQTAAESTRIDLRKLFVVKGGEGYNRNFYRIFTVAEGEGPPEFQPQPIMKAATPGQKKGN